MAVSSGAIAAPTTAETGLKDIFAKISHVYYNNKPIGASSDAGEESIANITPELALPILEGSVSFDTGSIDKTEIKLLDGSIWTSSETKGDSAITMQVASVSSSVNSLFLTQKETYSGISVNGVSGFGGTGWALDIKKSTGSLIMTDATGNACVILTNVEMTGSVVLGDGDNPAYFNVSVTPKANAAGESLIILTK